MAGCERGEFERVAAVFIKKLFFFAGHGDQVDGIFQPQGHCFDDHGYAHHSSRGRNRKVFIG